jgi:very-short-patch-repair endonuclease
MDREQLFQWLKNKEFSKIVQFLKLGEKMVHDDPISQTAVQLFFAELLANSDDPYIFQQLYMLQTGSFYHFTDVQLETILQEVCKHAKSDAERLSYVSKFPDLQISKQTIDATQLEQPKSLEHSQSQLINVELIQGSSTNLATSIFNSKQERLFFHALRNCFPNYLIYPNVALSTIINSKFIADVLTRQQLKYFYRTTVDFVVIDQFNDFKPCVVIELDSEWHRLNNQDKKDEMKNIIFKAAGVPLYRIEHTGRLKTIEEFEEAILATLQIDHRKKNNSNGNYVGCIDCFHLISVLSGVGRYAC